MNKLRSLPYLFCAILRQHPFPGIPNQMKTRTNLLTALSAAAISASTASAATIIINQDYESLSVGAANPIPNLGGDAVVDDSITQLFGATNTRYLGVTGNIGSPNGSAFTNDTQITFLSLDFIVDSASHNEFVIGLGDSVDPNNGALNFRIRGTASSSGLSLSTLQSSTTISQNTRYRVDIVVNTGASSVTYNAGGLGTQTLKADGIDAYLFDYATPGNSLQWANDGNLSTASNNANVDAIFMRNYSSRNVDVSLDNLYLATLTAIPEPSSGLLLMSGLGFLCVRRRRK